MPPRAKQPAPEQPDESQPESQPPEGSSDRSSTASSGASLIAEPGPEFEPGQAAKDASQRDGDRLLSVSPGGETGIQIEWDPAVVRGLLEAAGSGLHSIAGKAQEDWAFTATELRAIAGPLTRILNRYDTTRVAAATGDELAIVLGLAGYVMRSIQERKAVLELERQAQEEQEAREAQFGPQPPT